MYQYACILGREWKLSLAELISVFGYDALGHFSEEVALFRVPTPLQYDSIQTLGGTTRIIEIIGATTPESFPTDVLEQIHSHAEEPKIHFALASFGVKLPLIEMGMRMKKTLLNGGNRSVRSLNTHDAPVHSAVFKREKLSRTRMEWALIAINPHASLSLPDAAPHYFLGRTLACQDIDAYRRRDLGKSRDMVVGMMPPKLVQMMMNIAGITDFTLQDTVVYDPFCGLGTTLIEAAQRGVTALYGSDISPQMVDATQTSLEAFIAEEVLWQDRIRKAGGTPKKDSTQIQSYTFTLDAQRIADAFQIHQVPKNTTIISEGYLGQMMKKDEITQDRVFHERRTLTLLYTEFFAGLARAGFRGNIVMSFPFWKVGDVMIYFDALPEILDAHGFRIESVLPRKLNLNTKNGSLLYRRSDQQVGREIIHILPK